MAEMEGRENDTRVKVICQSFLPQQWRQTKCKLCFHDIMDHTKKLTQQQSQVLIRTSMNLEETLTENNGQTDIQIPSTKAETPDIIEPCYSPRSTYTTGSSKGSSDRLDDETEDTASHSSKFEMMKDSENEDDERRRSTLKGKVFPSHFGYEQQDSIDIEEGSNSPRTIKRPRGKSYHKRDSEKNNLLQFSAMMRSSNSSLCSFTSEYTDGYSDYDYDIRSITDDTDDYTESNDVVDELESLKPELKARVQNERRISRSKILDLERELEGQQDHYRANEVAKERQILTLQREIEGLKLELSSVKAHEHILALKSRLELEAKATAIHDLQHQVQSLQDQLCSHPEHDFSAETQQDVLNRDLGRAHNRIARLEEENTAFQEKTNLIEDLHNNDKELLQYLRKQLESLNVDLSNARENNRHLQDSLKLMEGTRNDYIKEQEKCTKLTKELESIRQKVKRRDRHIEDLEDDNVKLQQLKTELESQLSKRDFKMKKMERRLSELQSEVTKCNKEIADLTGEKKTFDEVRKLTDLKLKDLQGDSSDAASSEVENGKNIFIHTLEERIRHSESRAKELQLENDTLLKDLRDYCENLNNAEKDVEEYKDLLKEAETKNRKLREERTHIEKKNEWLQRKFHKSEQEKKRAINRRNDLEAQLAQLQEQYMINTDISLNQDPVDETDARMLKLKLQSTEAKLQMIEGNKGYLEKKVNSLERKVQDKENEIQRLLDSMERDSGAPSQDYDRSDVLERENIMLKSNLDELSNENYEQKQLVNQLEENNTHLDATIKNLNEKLETCNERLKELENANHKLGREAFRRSQCFTGSGREDEGFNELRSQNRILQEKVEKFNDLEEEVKQMGGKLKQEKGNIQWYSEENEKLKIKMTRLSQNIQSLENSKKEFEKTIHQLQNTNKELDVEVKRLEEKFEIYGDLFGTDSQLSSSLRRRSYQSDEERDEERMFKNALAPLMEEIKEKDTQIRALHEAMEGKNLQIELLTSELDRTERDIAAQITEKIRNMHQNDSSGENEHSEGEPCPENLICINKRHRNDSSEYISDVSPRRRNSDEFVSPTNTIPRKNSNVEQPGRISPELHLNLKKDYPDESNEVWKHSKNNNNDNNNTNTNTNTQQTDEELTVTTEKFYEILRDHHDTLEQKDLEYYRTNSTESPTPRDKIYKTIENRYSGSDSPTDNKFYITIENALLDHYHDDRPRTSLPSLTNIPNNDSPNKDYNDKSARALDDMYEQLAELECLVNIKYRSPQISPNNTLTIAKISPCKEVNNKNEKTDSNASSIENYDNSNSNKKSSKMRPFFNSATGKYDREEVEETCHQVIKDSENHLAEKGVDLSGLDDLIAEVNKKGNDYQEQVVQKKQKLQERKSVPITTVPTTVSSTVSTTKTIMPSIRTTRRFIKLGHSESLDSSSGYPSKPSVRSSSMVSDTGSVIGFGTSMSNTSSITSNGSQVSIIFGADPESDSNKASESSSDNTTNTELPANSVPYRRPNIDANKFLNSSFPNNNDTSKS